LTDEIQFFLKNYFVSLGRNMTRLTAIGFLLIYLTANTELHQLLRLPVFFDHLKEHRQENPEMGLIGFVILHYFSGNPKDADQERDEQLPFKSNDCVAAPSAIAILTFISFERLLDTPATGTSSSIYKSPFNPSSFQFTIWQPPRA
jgi:hypothetical protein